MTDTSTNTLALPYLQPYRRVTALALAYLALVDDMARPPQVVTSRPATRRHGNGGAKAQPATTGDD